MNWNQRDKNRAAKLIEKIVKAAGGWQATATAMNLKGRQQVRQWFTAGRVPVLHCQAFVELAKKHDINIAASDVNPEARFLAKTQGVS